MGAKRLQKRLARRASRRPIRPPARDERIDQPRTGKCVPEIVEAGDRGRALPDEAVGPGAAGVQDAAGDREDARPESSALSAVENVPLGNAASTTSTATDRPAMMRLRAGNCYGKGVAPQSSSETTAPSPARRRASVSAERRG